MALTVYSKEGCSFCVKAKNLLAIRGVAFEEKVVGTDISRDDFMSIYPSARTLPQIIREDGHVIGGYTDLVEYLGPSAPTDDGGA